MSAFVSILERSGRAADRDELARLASPLEPYGPHLATFCRGPIGIAVRHRDPTRARFLHGPVEEPRSGWVIAVAGRFSPVEDSRREQTMAPSERHQPVVHASRALACSSKIETDGVGAIADFLAGVAGTFVFVAGSSNEASITLARDHLGGAKLYYRLDEHRLLAASEPAAILRHADVSSDLDEISIARFLGFQFGLSERSHFQEIRELPPAHLLHVTAKEARTLQYWRFRTETPTKPDAEEVTLTFRNRLSRAIADEMAGLEPQRVALSLSGGLDSSALAALAPRGLKAFSWTFLDDPSADERDRIELVSRHLQLPIHWVSGDGLHPLCEDFRDRFIDQNSPYLNPFSALKRRLYEQARAAGCDRVLVGDGGDTHFAAAEYWLRDSLLAGRPRAFRSLVGTLRRAVDGDRFARRALRRILPLSRPTRLRPHPAPWLTASARRLLGPAEPSPILPAGRHASRHELIAGVKHSELESEEQRLFARCGVERGNPFWSWPLLELTIHLSADWYHFDTRSKILTKEALGDLLPVQAFEEVRTGSLGDFFLRGLELRREELVDTVFRRPLSDWPRFVRREWVEPYLSSLKSIAFGHTILWRVISYELWCRLLLGAPLGGKTGPEREPRPKGHPCKQGPKTHLSGLVHGVVVTGHLPESFKRHLLPSKGGFETLDSITVGYRVVDRLPEVEEFWSSANAQAGASAGGRFALVHERDGFGLLVADQGHGLFGYRHGRIEITWTSEDAGAPHYFFACALPLWLETRGVPVLHGSAVVIDGGAVGFLGASGVGKSVLAASLSSLGCELLADDGLALRRDAAGRWLTFHGPPLLRLWPSALQLLKIPVKGLARVHENLEKRQLTFPAPGTDLSCGRKSDSAALGVHLAALYILERAPGESHVGIEPVTPGEALVRLIEHSVAAGPAEALGLSARRFELLADVAEMVPTRRLQLPTGGSAQQVREAILGDLAEPGAIDTASAEGSGDGVHGPRG